MSKSLLIHRGTYALIPVVLCKILLFTSLLNQKACVEHSRCFTEIDVNYQNTPRFVSGTSLCQLWILSHGAIIGGFSFRLAV